MLQELRTAVTSINEIVTEIAVRFKNGDPAKDELKRLETLLPTLVQQAGTAGELPDDLRTEITALLDRVRATVATGDDWLARAEQELATESTRDRLQRAYGAT